MAMLSLKVSVAGCKAVKTIQFDPGLQVFDACRFIRDKIAEANEGSPQEYGLFLADEDPKKGVWLESARTLEYYLLRNGDLLEYKKKQRILRVRMLDGSVKAIMVDDSHTVAQLMITICSKIGIANHEEYSLVRDISDTERERTLTLKRDKSIAKDQKKMDEMKKKLHTDDEMNWLDHSKTLREQDIIDQEETLLLRRKYFFSDQNVDARDPVQLNLLYVQTRDAILKGAHPINVDFAVQFAGIQCQIQFGDHVESKHKPGFLELRDFLPKEYVKVKGIEKKIYMEHKKYIGTIEVDAKMKYTQLARSLKTYGITFFLVKEKLKGKNKLVPRLLGITKESVVRVDEKTKEILKTWPLTTVRRWAASPNSFTLDFGDYADSYYSVQTTEGEQISQLISGYIDIILKKQKAKDHLGIDGDEESTMYEDSVSPAKATIIQHQSAKIGVANMGSVALPAVLRAGDASGQAQFSAGTLQKAQQSQITCQQVNSSYAAPGQNAQMQGLGQAQRALLGTIADGLAVMETTQAELQSKAELPPLGSDPSAVKWKESQKDMSRQKVGSQLSAMNAATAQMVTLTSTGPDDTDYTAVGSAVQTISTNMGDFSKDVRLLAALEEAESDGDKLLEAARRLAGAFSDMLTVAQPGSNEPRQNLLNAASRVGEASHDIMIHVEPDSELDSAYKDALLALAKAVANATATLVLKAKSVAGKCENQADKNAVIGSATQCALATSQLVTCTKVVAPTIANPECQEQLVEAAKQVAKSVEGVVDTAQSTCNDDPSLKDLGVAATAVTKALDDLMNHIKRGSGRGQVDEVDSILVATDRLFNSMGDTPEMVRQARILALATSQLVNALKNEAESQSDSDQQKRLLAAAKLLADATAKMVEAAKGCASTPQDKNQQQALRQAAEDLRLATSVAAAGTLRKQLLTALQQASKHAASSATQLINAAGGAGRSNRNQASQQQLMTQCKAVADDVIPRLVHALRATVQNPDNQNAQLALLTAAQDMLQPCTRMLASAKAAVPTVGDAAAALSLSNAVKNLNSALAELRAAAAKVHDASTSTNSIDAALEQVRALEADLTDLKRSIGSGHVAPLPGETADSCATLLGSTSKTVGSSMAQLLTAAAQGNENYTGTAARDTANALRVLASAVRGVAATSSNRDLQDSIVDHARDVMDKSANLIEEAKKAVEHPQNPENQTRLAQVAKAVSQALNNCVNCLPGLREVDVAVKYITTVSMKLSQPQFPSTGRGFQEVQMNLNARAADLNQATSDIVTAASHEDAHRRVVPASNRFGQAYEEFIDGGLEMAGVTKDPNTQTQIVTGLRSVSMVSSRLLMATKSILVDPNAPNAKNQLTQAARSVTESINHLINVCTVAAPGQKECDMALRQIQMTRPLMENPSEPLNDGTYFDSLDGVIERSKALADAMTGISANAKHGELQGFCDCVANFANAVCGIIESSAQAAYLVGIVDPASEPGRPGLVDQSQFARANQAIQTACQNISSPSSNPQQVLSAATLIAKHTSLLCNTCRVASSKTTNPVAKRHFVQSAKDVANSTANLVRAIKVLDSEFNDENRKKCAEAAKPLLQAVDVLSTFASSPEFASVPARISEKARRSQQPITSAGKELIEGACNMILAAKQLAINPRDPPIYQGYSTHSHSVSEAIKRLVSSVREGAPGHRECDSSISLINRYIQELDQAALSASSQTRPRSDVGGSMQNFQEQTLSSARQLLEYIDPIRSAAKGETENLPHLVSSASSYLEPLKNGAIGCASKTMNSRLQMALLDQTKTVIESMQNLMIAAKEAGGNRKSTHVHGAVDETADSAREMILELIQTLEDTAASSGIVTILVDNLTKAISRADEHLSGGEDQLDSFVDYQTNLVRLAKQIARTVQEIMTKSVNNVQELGMLANSLTRDYCALAGDSRGAVASCANPQIGSRIRSAVQQLGGSCIDLVRDAGNLQCNPSDGFAKRDLGEHGKKVLEHVTNVLMALQSGSHGTQACINAASTISGIIGDLDTTIMFATAGTLNPDKDESFGDHRENILKTAKALVEDTKTLVAGAASNQEQLAGAAQSAVMTITRLTDCVKLGAASLGSEQPEAQVLLINAVKDVASALSDLILATKNASGKAAHDPSMSFLKDTAKTMVTNVTSLLKTVKTVEDEAARGTQALESSIEAIGQELRAYAATDHVEKKITPDELVRWAKPITIATAKAVAAGNSGRQEDVIAAANLGRKAVFDLLHACKSGAAGVDDPALQRRVLAAGNACATAYKELLEHINVILQRPSPENKQKLALLSKNVAAAMTEIIQAAEAIKGTEWADPYDPTVIAENELLSAANSIEAAARKLSQLPVQRAVPRQADESLAFEEQIVGAAKAIAAATAALVKAASLAQRELVSQGKLGMGSSSNLDEDSQWSQGLISAARMVAAATHNLCDAANALVQGQASEEKLISSAKQVASSTAQLLVACKVKADPNSQAMRRLQAAGNAVKRATEALVVEAQKVRGWSSYEETTVTVDQRMVGSMAQLITAQEDILIKERELESARKKLEVIRRARYKDRPDYDSTDSGTDF